MSSIWGPCRVPVLQWRPRTNFRFWLLHHSQKRVTFLPSPLSSSLNDDSASPPNKPQANYDPSEDLFGLAADLQPRKSISGAPEPRSWFGPNGQYIKELPCPSCRGRGYTPCEDCGIERSRLDCTKCNGKGVITCHQCLGDRVIWEESIDERLWEKARSDSPLNFKEDDEVDNLDIKLVAKRKTKRIYQSPTPEVGLKISRSLKSLNAKTGLFSKRMKIIHQNPLLHAQRVAAIKFPIAKHCKYRPRELEQKAREKSEKAKSTPAARKRASEVMKEYFSDPENRHKRSIAMKGVKFYCKNCSGEGHRRHYCPELVDRDRQFSCRVCGVKGHNRRTCPDLKKSEQNPKVPRHHTCRICGESGHNRRTCPLSAEGRKAETSRNRVYRCRLCQGRGHNARTCPSRENYLLQQ